MGIDITDEDNVPGVGELLRDRRADAGAAAGHERDARMGGKGAVTAEAFDILIHCALSNE